MMKIAAFFVVFYIHCYAGIESQYRKLENKLGCSTIDNVDYVYLINLDQRPEKWTGSLKELLPYGIFPERYSGIYGWTLSPQVLHEMALKFEHGMWTGKEWVTHFPLDGDGTPTYVSLDGSCYGKGYFSGWTVKGTLGCTLSHLSVLKDAYDEGYKTIWILEDDIRVLENPHKLSKILEELDALVGSDGWDALYTDFDYLVVDPAKDLAAQIPAMWRPDMPSLNIGFLAEHQDVGEKFMKIGSRMRAHSIIYRRCGIEKILEFYRAHDNFLPFDQEIALIPGIRLYVVKNSIVSFNETTSDTRCKYFQK